MSPENQSKSNTRAQDQDAGNSQTTLSNRAHEVAEGARQGALDRVESARASTQAAKERAAEGVRKFGATVRKVGEHLRVEDQHYVADKATDVSQRLDNIATYLSSAELATLARDARAVARSNPGWFYGGAFVLGLAAGRFLKGGSDGDGDRSHDARVGQRTRRTAQATGGTTNAPRADAQNRPGSPSTSSPRANERSGTGASR